MTSAGGSVTHIKKRHNLTDGTMAENVRIWGHGATAVWYFSALDNDCRFATIHEARHWLEFATWCRRSIAIAERAHAISRSRNHLK